MAFSRNSVWLVQSSVKKIKQKAIFWWYKPSLWPWFWRHQRSLFAWHTGSGWRTNIPGVVTKGWVVPTISSGENPATVIPTYPPIVIPTCAPTSVHGYHQRHSHTIAAYSRTLLIPESHYRDSCALHSAPLHNTNSCAFQKPHTFT